MKLLKFGTSEVGYVGSEFAPFKCSTCKFSEPFMDEFICTNDFVAEDEAVPKDSYGNVIIESEACCNMWTPQE